MLSHSDPEICYCVRQSPEFQTIGYKHNLISTTGIYFVIKISKLSLIQIKFQMSPVLSVQAYH